MPTYRNDSNSNIHQIVGIAGQAIDLAPGQSGQTYRLYDHADLTETDPAPYWGPALAVHQPACAGPGDLAGIDLADDCHAMEVWNDSAAVLTVRLRAAAAVALTIPPHASRRIDGPPGIGLRAVADTLLIHASAIITAGQLIVTELRKEGSE